MVQLTNNEKAILTYQILKKKKARREALKQHKIELGKLNEADSYKATQHARKGYTNKFSNV